MQVLNVVDHLWDNPAAIPKRQLGRLLYGVDSVFARTPRPEQVQGLTRDDIVAHLARWQRPDNAVLGVAGAAHKCPRHYASHPGRSLKYWLFAVDLCG